MDLQQVESQATEVLREILLQTGSMAGALIVIGCSTSEVVGERIGSASNMEVAQTLYAAFSSVAHNTGIHLAYQCCEHLNRAIVLPREDAEHWRLDPVRVIPVAHAGGAMAATAYQSMPDPVVVESVDARAAAGLDIGDTLIGMHIHPVVVPLRLQHKSIGLAHLTAAYSRPKLIGGSRAIYEIH